jgi:DNA processing protein
LENKLRYKIGVGLIKGIGPVLARQLIAYLGDEEAVFKESFQALSKIPGIGAVLAESIRQSDVLSRADAEISFVQKHNLDVLYFTDDRYPFRLRSCDDAPLLLYSKGNVDYNSLHLLSVVGTRRPSENGKGVCEKIIESLAGMFPDLIVVSGMAYGIDICAHRQSLKSGLATVGVVAHGLDRIYPPLHRDVAMQMLSNGALITEFMSGTDPDRQNFVRRNRIIAGLSDATLVVESGVKGGALITADIASSYQRDVLAVPGFPGVETSAGCNYLIKNNIAALVESADDVAAALNWEVAKQTAKAVQRRLFPEFSSPDEQILFEMLLQEGEMTASLLSARSGIAVSKVNALMLTLEFDGWVRAMPGSVFKIMK